MLMRVAADADRNRQASVKKEDLERFRALVLAHICYLRMEGSDMMTMT